MTSHSPNPMPPPRADPGNEQEAVQRLQEALTRFVGAVLVRPGGEAAMLDLPILQIRCLRGIAEEEGQKLRELAQRVGLPLPSVSRLVDRLVRAGLVERHTDPSDRRAVKLRTTEKAREILARQRAMREAQLAACMRFLTPSEVRQVIAGLDLLTGAAQQAQTEPGAPM